MNFPFYLGFHLKKVPLSITRLKEFISYYNIPPAPFSSLFTASDEKQAGASLLIRSGRGPEGGEALT